MQKKQAIGVFDSGVGGLTVVKAVQQALPHEKIIYLGDTARVPYGSRSLETILRYSQNAAQFLMKQDVKMILIACNTASAAAITPLEESLPIPVLGAVGPGAEMAAKSTGGGSIGVLATLATVRAGAYTKAILKHNASARIVSQACPLLVPLIEEGWTDPEDPIVNGIVTRYLEMLHRQAADIDTLVLGCTHYPLLAPAFARVAKRLWQQPVTLVDSAVSMARSTEKRLQSLGLLNDSLDEGTLECFVTDEARVLEIGNRFLGKPLSHIEVIDL